MANEDGPHQISYLGELQRLELRPGDVFVLSTDRHLPAAAHQHIRNAWRIAMGNVRLLIIDGGMKLGVVNAGIVAEGRSSP
ncbi:MAG: hypothetical protein AB7I42_26600 [Bradyrhizobium sp.]